MNITTHKQLHFYQRLMFYILLVLLGTNLTHKAQAQAPVIQWQKLLGGDSYEGAQAVHATTDGGSIIVGTTGSSNSGDVGLSHGNGDIWVIKLSAAGAIQWQKLLGGTEGESANDVQQTTDGGYIILGTTNSVNSGDVVGLRNGGISWLIKLDASGTIQWQKVIWGGVQYDFATSVRQTSDGGYILAGITSPEPVLGVGANSDAWVVKLTATGVVQWQKLLGGNSEDVITSIQQTTDGGYIMAGYTRSSNSGDIVGANHGNFDAWIVKLSATGTIQWQKLMGAYFSDYAMSIQQTTDGGYIMGGSSQSDAFGQAGATDVSLRYWAVKLTASGGLQWEKLYGGFENTLGNQWEQSIQQTTDGGYIMVGYTNASNSGDMGANHGGDYQYSYDAWVVKITATGTLQWQKMLGGVSNESISSIRQTKDGGYVLVGYAESSQSGDVTGVNHGNKDLWVVKLSPSCSSTPSVSGNNSVCFGATIQLTGSTTTGTVRWSSADTTAAKVSQTGVVTGIFQGFFDSGRNTFVRERIVDINYAVTEGGCTSVATKRLTVYALPFPIPVTIVEPFGAFKGSITASFLQMGASTSFNNGPFMPHDNGTFLSGPMTYPDLTVGTYKLKTQLTGCTIEQDVVLKERVVAFDPNKCYRIVNKSTKKVLQVKDGSQADGAQIYQWASIFNTGNNNNSNQLWKIVKLADGTYNFISTSSGKLMDVTDNSPAGYCVEGTIIQQFTADGTNSQKWRIELQEDRTFKIYNVTCNKALRVENNSFADGASVGIKNDFGTLAFKWLIEESSCFTASPEPNRCYRIVNKATKKVLEIKDGVSTDGAQIYQWASTNNRLQQLWKTEYTADGKYTIRSVKTGKVIDVVDNTAAGFCTEGTIIQQFPFDGTNSQQWAIIGQTDGSYKILNATCNKYLRVESASTADGANVGIKNDFGSDAFKWFFQPANCTTGAVLSATNATFSFEARAAEGRAKLQWITNTSDKTDYFEIERLNQQGNFEVLGRQNTEGGNDMKSYTFTDNDPLEGDNLYRINSVSQNGPPQYSEVKKVSFTKNDGIRIYPNPADDYIAVDLRRYEGKTVGLYLYNSVGLLVKKQIVEKASTAPQRVDTQDFSTGTYLMRVQSEGKRDVLRQVTIAK